MRRNKPLRGTQLKADHPLSRGLVGCWVFNEGSGLIVNDLSGYNNNGDFVGLDNSVWGVSSLGTIINFAGTNGFIQCPEGPYSDIGTGEYSIIGFIKTSSIASEAIATNRESASPFWWFGLFNNKLIFSSTGGNAFSNDIINDGVWHHVVGSRKRGFSIAYVDGGPGAPVASTQDVSNTTPLIIGKFGSAGFYWEGKIAFIMIYNRGLSELEIKSHYQNPYQMFQKLEYGFLTAPIPIGEVAPTIINKTANIDFSFKIPGIDISEKTPIIDIR